VGALLANVALGITLAWFVGTPGIALATAVAAVANACVLGVLLRRRLGGLFTESSGANAARMVAAAGIAGALCVAPYLWILSRWSSWEIAGRIGGTVGLYVGIGVAYLAVARALGIDETARVWKRLRIPRRRDG
jgi:peptidoglycan biosynthesis protein MviN/MurJ (putative lipid II flippase)